TVEIVEGPDCVAVAQKSLAYMATNETGATGDQKIHGAIMGFHAPSSKFQKGIVSSETVSRSTAPRQARGPAWPPPVAPILLKQECDWPEPWCFRLFLKP